MDTLLVLLFHPINERKERKRERKKDKEDYEFKTNYKLLTENVESNKISDLRRKKTYNS